MALTEIVLTGGPAAGKTTAMAYLPEKLLDWGFRVFTVPEVATLFIKDGMPDIGKLVQDKELYFQIEKQMLLMQLNFRERFQSLAKLFPNDKCVILYDRGPMDVKAYMDPLYFDALIHDLGLNIVDLRDSYDAVFHLRTTALGAEEFYTKANNKARIEGAEEAKLADIRTLHAWIGHPNLKVIDNYSVKGFSEKLKLLLKRTTRVLGLPSPLEIERKFLVKSVDFSKIQNAQKITIEQWYLNIDEEKETRIRKRTQDGSSLFYFTQKIGKGLSREETERRISYREFLGHLNSLEDLKPLVKDRYCFEYNDQYLELDLFRDLNINLLEIELTEESDKVSIPDFIKVNREVTEDPFYSNAELWKLHNFGHRRPK